MTVVVLQPVQVLWAVGAQVVEMGSILVTGLVRESAGG